MPFDISKMQNQINKMVENIKSNPAPAPAPAPQVRVGAIRLGGWSIKGFPVTVPSSIPAIAMPTLTIPTIPKLSIDTSAYEAFAKSLNPSTDILPSTPPSISSNTGKIHSTSTMPFVLAAFAGLGVLYYLKKK
jgi:hypothetical protein